MCKVSILMPCKLSKSETSTEVSAENPKTTEAPETAETGKLEAYNDPTSPLQAVHTLPISIPKTSHFYALHILKTRDNNRSVRRNPENNRSTGDS